MSIGKESVHKVFHLTLVLWARHFATHLDSFTTLCVQIIRGKHSWCKTQWRSRTGFVHRERLSETSHHNHHYEVSTSHILFRINELLLDHLKSSTDRPIWKFGAPLCSSSSTVSFESLSSAVLSLCHLVSLSLDLVLGRSIQIDSFYGEHGVWATYIPKYYSRCLNPPSERSGYCLFVYNFGCLFVREVMHHQQSSMVIKGGSATPNISFCYLSWQK